MSNQPAGKKRTPRARSIGSPRVLEIMGDVEGYSPASIELELGGKNVKIYKMTVGSTRALIKLVEPYIKRIATALFTQVGLEGLQDEERVKTALRALIGEQVSEILVTVPETLVTAFARLINIPENDKRKNEWLLNTVAPGELLGVLPALDELNDFGALYQQALGVFTHFNHKYEIGKAIGAGQAEES